MSIRSILSKKRLQDNTDGGDGGSGGAGGEGGASDANDNSQNNKDTNLISHDTMWDAASNEDNSNANNANQQQQQQAPDANAVFDTHIESLDFSTGIDIAASMTAIQQGDAEVFAKLINQIGANAYRNSLVDANKVVQQRVDKMADTVKADVSSSNATSALVQEMNTALPFTKSAAFAPIANLTLTQFLGKGVPPAKAIEEVGKYFQGLSGEVAKLNPGAPNSRPTGGFGGNMNNGVGNQDEGETDWLEMLGGKPT